MINRRQFITVSAALSSALALTGGLQLMSWWDQDPDSGLHVLSASETLTVEALAEAAYPRGGHPEPGGGELRLSAYLDQVLRMMEPAQSRLLKLLLQTLDRLPLLTAGQRFSSLDAQAAQQTLRAWLESDLAELRAAVQSLVLLLGMGYTTHPRLEEFFSPLYGCRYGA